MMCESFNEAPVISHLFTLSFVEEFSDFGMLALSQHPELFFSPYRVAIIDLNDFLSAPLDGDGDFVVDGSRFYISPVEVKRRLSPNTFRTSIWLSSAKNISAIWTGGFSPLSCQKKLSPSSTSGYCIGISARLLHHGIREWLSVHRLSPHTGWVEIYFSVDFFPSFRACCMMGSQGRPDHPYLLSKDILQNFP